MGSRGRRSATRRAETWLWTGPLGHLLGSALDLAEVIARQLAHTAAGRLRGRIAGSRGRLRDRGAER